MVDLNLEESTPEAQKRTATLKEMGRRSQDRIRVYNPTSDDYTVRFDGIGFIIPGRTKDIGHGLGTAVVFRYVAENYRTQMIDLLLTSKLDDAVLLENQRRANLGMLPMTKFIGGEELTFCNSLRTDNEEARRKLIPIVWLGLAERYGTELREESLSGKPKDDRPLDERLLDEIENKSSRMPTPVKPVETIIIKSTVPSEAVQDLRTKDVFTLRKIAREKGIETDKKMKKEELIERLTL